MSRKRVLLVVVLVVASLLLPSGTKAGSSFQSESRHAFQPALGPASQGAQSQCSDLSLETMSGCSSARTKGCYLETQDPYAGLWVNFVCEEDPHCPPERPRMCTWSVYSSTSVETEAKQAGHLVVQWDHSGWHQLGWFLGKEWKPISSVEPFGWDQARSLWTGLHITGPDQSGLLVAVWSEDGTFYGYHLPGAGRPQSPEQLWRPPLESLGEPAQ